MQATPARSSRLKRRVGVAGLDVQSGSELQAYSLGIEDTITEPPLKKFKALFDASNPERMDIESLALADSMLIASSTQTQSETQIRSSRTLRSGKEGPALAVLQEEEEESQIGDNNPNPIASRTLKRRLESVDEYSESDATGHEASVNTFSANKKRAVENVNSIERSDGPPKKPPSTRAASKPPSAILVKKDKHGAAPGKPDTDAAFLKAIASTKRGKKAEDKFDREFNNLKISKPELEQQEPEEEWAVLADFGDDTGLRGNFMVVVELDVFKKDKGSQQDSALKHAWVGKPNFKKFKKVLLPSPSYILQIFIEFHRKLSIRHDPESNCSSTMRISMGWDLVRHIWLVKFPVSEFIPSACRKGDEPRGQLRSENVLGNESQMDSQIHTSTQPKGRKRAATKPLFDSDDGDAVAPRVRASRDNPASRFGSVLPQKGSVARAENVTKKKPLFLDSDDEENHDKVDRMDVDPTGEGVDEEQTLQSSFETGPTVGRRSTRETKSRKPAPIIVDDDSDDDAVFKGFKGQKKGR